MHGQGVPATARKVKAGSVDFPLVRNVAFRQAEALVKAWLPDGRREGDEWVARNPTRADEHPGSFKINVRSCEWADFATGDRGGDLIALYAYLHGLNQADAARRIAVQLGIQGETQSVGLTLEAYAAAKRLPVEFLRDLGLRTVGKTRSMISIPYRKRDGSLYRYRLRAALDKPEDKAPRMFWDKREEKIGALLYGLDVLPANGCPVILVEGESDVHTLWHRGFDAVGCPGAGNYCPERDDDELESFDIIAFVERDKGGEALIKQLGRSRHTARIKLAYLDGFKDVSEVYCQAPERFDDIIKAAIAAAVPFEQMQTRDVPSARWKRPELPDGFRYLKDGAVEYLTPRKSEDDEEIWSWLCSPIEVLAETRGQDEKGWGLLIRVQTPDGVWHTQAMTRSLFSTQSEDFIAMLADLGVKFTPTAAVKGKMRTLLALSKSEKRARTAMRVGWYGDKTFVLPDEAFGELGHEPIVFQPERPIAHAYKLGGTFDGWQREVAALAIGNSRLTFAASAAFAGPLLQPLNIESGGFHLRGDGSTGKTSSMWIAGSVWGGGSLSKGFMHSWRTTDNGLESRAVLHSDTVLLLDELGQVNGGVAARTIYMLANGQGKARAAQSGEGKPVAEFRVLFLSTGEISLAAKLGEEGLAAMAGQETRFIDLEADAGAGMGAFEDIHDFASPADFSDAITNACAVHYGHAARAYLRRVMDAPEMAFTEARAMIAAFPCPDHATGQVRRVAKRFALVAAAGELAVRFGILPWPHETATQAAQRMFREWLERRGSTGALESVKAIDQVRAMIERHGASRFVPWETPSATVINRLGFARKDDVAGTRYYAIPSQNLT